MIEILKKKLKKKKKKIVSFDFTDLFTNIYLSDPNKVINLQFKKYKNKLNFLNHADANYFQTLTNFIIRNNHYLQNSKLYLQKENS